MDHASMSLDDPLPDDQGTDHGLPEHQSTIQAFVEASSRYRNLVIEYCTLAQQDALLENDEDRLNDILTQAIDDPLLSFWLDEADHWLGQHQSLLNADSVQQQQQKLKRMIGQTWVDSLWGDLQHRTKALQAYLQRVGLYSGAIDGVMGPITQRALESFKNVYPDDLPLELMGG